MYAWCRGCGATPVTRAVGWRATSAGCQPRPITRAQHASGWLRRLARRNEQRGAVAHAAAPVITLAGIEDLAMKVGAFNEECVGLDGNSHLLFIFLEIGILESVRMG